MSSGEQAGWGGFRERPQPPDVELLSPASELVAVLQRYRNDLDAERAAVRNAVASTLSIAIEQAVLVFQLAQLLGRNEQVFAKAGLGGVHRQLRIVKDQMLEALTGGDLTVADPSGRSFDDAAEMVHVVGWRHGPEFADEVVAETIEPIVLHAGKVVRQGRVIMGAPSYGGGAPQSNEENE